MQSLSYRLKAFTAILYFFFTGCTEQQTTSAESDYTDSAETLIVDHQDTSAPREAVPDNTLTEVSFPDSVTVDRNALVEYAKTLQGIPYLYGSTDPQKGFDCSGFITYVFNHFRMSVPRSSVDFTNYGEEIPKQQARPGDLILFTGTDSLIRTVGHMGIIVDNNADSLHFIHSTSGKTYGVTVTPLNKYYMGRFVKTIKVLP